MQNRARLSAPLGLLTGSRTTLAGSAHGLREGIRNGKSKMRDQQQDNWQEYGKAPGRILWPIRRIGHFLEKFLLWPIADSFRKVRNGLRYRSPFAYIAATLMVTVTAGAVAAAVYFYKQSEKGTSGPVVAETAIPTETVVPPIPTPTPVPTQTEDTTPDSGSTKTTLQGVVPSFTTSGRQKNSKKAANPGLPATVVRPAPAPKSPPLKVAHRFATTFVGYEIGEKNAARGFTRTATPGLAKDLRRNPPKLPSAGQIPKATVVNVVGGKKNGNRMDVSVALMRTGAASELRLTLTRKKGNGWLVSQVRG